VSGRVASRIGLAAMLITALSVVAARVSFAQSALRATEPLPLIEVRADTGSAVALLLSGDGGWADGDRALADALALGGISVVGLDTRRYLRGAKRTPESVARDAAWIIQQYSAVWHRDRLVLVGYSRGADLAPFIVRRWPDGLRRRLALVALVGLADHASFEFHWQDVLHDVRRATDLATRPELERIRGVRMLCVYAEDERGSLCPALDSTLARVARIPGGHVLHGSTGTAVGALVVDAMRRRQ